MRKKVIAILIDALGFEVVRRHGFCRSILTGSSPIETVLGYSSAAIPSLLTGCVPAEHGAWSMYKYDPDKSPFKWLRHMPAMPWALERRVRNFAKKKLVVKNNVTAYFDLYSIPLKELSNFDLAQRRNPYDLKGCGRESLFDRLQKEKIGYRTWDYRTPEKENFCDLLQAITREERFLFLYTAELDALMHENGISGPEIKSKLDYYEEMVERLIAGAGKAGHRTEIYIFSDHGMTEVSGTVDVWNPIREANIRMDGATASFYDATMARFWAKGETRDKIGDLLDKIPGISLVSNERLQELGCYFENQSYGELIYVTDPGIMIVPSFMGEEPLKAMHGYDPEDKFSRACLLTNNERCAAPSSILEIKEFLINRILEDR